MNLAKLERISALIRFHEPLMPGPEDGPLLSELWQRHRIPVSTGSELVQVQKLKQLRAAHALFLAGELLDLLARFNEEGIRAIPLKGPVLAQQLFGDVGGRQSIDLDIWVEDSNMEVALGLLQGDGFEIINPQHCSSVKDWERFFRVKKDVRLRHPDKELLVELHQSFFYPGLYSDASSGALLEHSMKFGFLGRPLEVMSYSNTFLYLAIHGASHQYFRLFWLKDFARALETWDIDHTYVLGQAHRLSVLRLLGVSLMLAKEIFGTEIPSAYHPYIKKEGALLLRLRRIAVRRISGPEDMHFRQKLERHLFFIQLQSGLKYWLIYLINLYQRWYIRKFLGGH